MALKHSAGTFDGNYMLLLTIASVVSLIISNSAPQSNGTQPPMFGSWATGHLPGRGQLTHQATVVKQQQYFAFLAQSN